MIKLEYSGEAAQVQKIEHVLRRVDVIKDIVTYNINNMRVANWGSMRLEVYVENDVDVNTVVSCIKANFPAETFEFMQYCVTPLKL